MDCVDDCKGCDETDQNDFSRSVRWWPGAALGYVELRFDIRVYVPTAGGFARNSLGRVWGRIGHLQAKGGRDEHRGRIVVVVVCSDTKGPR